MNWKLILQLSLFGAAMGVATVFIVPPNVEPFCWLAIFLVCAATIAKRCTSRYFLHGLCVSLVNSVWITSTHIALFDTYVAGHAQEAAMAAQMGSPRLMMLVTGPVVGLVSGIVLGLFSLGASRMLKPAVA
jgi:hypothetical protein